MINAIGTDEPLMLLNFPAVFMDCKPLSLKAQTHTLPIALRGTKQMIVHIIFTDNSRQELIAFGPH